MNKTIITMLKTNITGQLNGADLGGGICIAGSPGIGKTATYKQIAKDMNLNMYHISVPELSTEVLSGLPEFMPAPNMDKYLTVARDTESIATKWTVPEMIEIANTLSEDPTKDGCLLVIDDLHRINMAVAPYLYGLLGERKLGAFKLAPKVVIMGAMNDSDEAGFSGMDSPIKDRLGLLPVPFDFDYWFENFGKGLHFYIASFLKTHSTYAQEDESTEIEQFGTPRSWTHLANEFELYDRKFIQEHTTLLAKQKVSTAASQELAKHVAYIEAIDFSKVIAEKRRIDIADLKPIDQILYAYMINYVDTLKDAEYVMSLIDTNISSSNFIGFIIGELYNKFQQSSKGKPVNPGVTAMINKRLRQSYSGTKLSEKDAKLFDKLEFKQHAELFKIASEFIN